MGDHPPITPVRAATEGDVGGGDAWRLYDYVTRHFLGSVSPDCLIRRTHAVFSAGSETFSAGGVSPLKPGFTAIMPWKVCCTSASSAFIRPLLTPISPVRVCACVRAYVRE